MVFMGTPDFSVPTLGALADAGHEITQVYTRPPAAGGRRGRQEVKSPVHQTAETLGIPVSTPMTLKSQEEQARFLALEPQVAVVVAYGLLLPSRIIIAPSLGCWNAHASLLPRWRGAAPIQRAILAGDTRTGVNIMRMEEGLDTGPVALSSEIPITPDMDAATLHDALSALTARLVVEAMADLETGTLHTSLQAQEGVTYARKIEKSETRINWQRPAKELHNHIRGLSPFPGAWFEADFGADTPERVKALACELVAVKGAPGEILDDDFTIACGEGALRLTRLQRAGRKVQEAEEFMRGSSLPIGMKLA